MRYPVITISLTLLLASCGDKEAEKERAYQERKAERQAKIAEGATALSTKVIGEGESVTLIGYPSRYGVRQHICVIYRNEKLGAANIECPDELPDYSD